MLALIGAVLIYLRESQVWVWPFAMPQVFYSLIFATWLIAALITERKRKTRVYLRFTHWIFVDSTLPKSYKGMPIVVGLGALLFATGCFIAFYDEPLDLGLQAFYAPDATPVPDRENVAIALMGISAPLGTDLFEHGRFVSNAIDSTDYDKAQKKIDAKGELRLTINGDELDCWIWLEPRGTDRICPDANGVKKILADNRELLNRYRSMYLLPAYRPSYFGRNGRPRIALNKLIAAEIGLDLRSGNHEAAYQKWRGNYIFISRMVGAETSMVDKLLWQVPEGISLSCLEELLFTAPSIRLTHSKELLSQLNAPSIDRWNLKGMLRAENRPLARMFEGDLQSWVRPNVIRNRAYRLAQAFLAVDQSNGEKLIVGMNQVGENLTKDKGWSLNEFLYLGNESLAKLMLSSQVEIPQMADSWLRRLGEMRLLSLSIIIANDRIADRDISQFLLDTAPILRNPYSGEPMRWSLENRVLYFCLPSNHGSVAQMRLPGGARITDTAQLCLKAASIAEPPAT